MSMPKLPLVALCALAITAPGAAQAQPVPRSFDASPDVYRVIAKNEQYKVIAVTWKPGQKDVLHAHPASAVYYLTDCALRLYMPDGSTREGFPKTGMALVQAPIAAHVVENIGTADCRVVMFEPA